MSDEVTYGRFFPSQNRPAPTQHPPAKYTIPLSEVRYILKGQFFHPTRNRDVPLPTHEFYLVTVQDTKKMIHGVPSQDDGVSWIPYEADLAADTHGSVWELSFVALFPRPGGGFGADTDSIARGEAFIDLDTMRWVRPSDVAIVEHRKLLRIPTWTSYMKARSGGFVDSPPNTGFQATGLLRQSQNELKAYGTPQKPWLVQIDHGLFRNFVRFHYYDLRAKSRKPVPRGLVVEARHTQALNLREPGRVAAGTAIDDSGTVYLLHDRTQEASRDTQYYFTTASPSGAHGVIDLTESNPNLQVRMRSHDPSSKPEDRYLLPRHWHSRGMQPWMVEDVHGFGLRQPLARLATAATSATSPLKFHLDDAVLATDTSSPISVANGARITLFDHFLSIRDPDPRAPHFWKEPLAGNYLVAEDAVYVNTDGFERATLLVYHDGAFYDLREKRIALTGGVGSTPYVGARAAIKEDVGQLHQIASYVEGNPTQPASGGVMPHGPGRSIFHLVDASDVTHRYETQRGVLDTKLMHLLVFIPLVLRPGNARSEEFARLQLALTTAAEWWDLEHPGHPGAPAGTGQKSYALVPESGATAGAKVVKVRHFFAPAPPAHPGAIVVTLAAPFPGQPNGGSTDAVRRRMTLFAGDFRPESGGVAEPGQDAGTTRFVLPHELHHVLGYPDEYWTNLPETDLPKFNQDAIAGALARPYRTDMPSLMNNGSALRLRHYWNYASRLREEAAFKAMLDGLDYAPERAKFGAERLLYKLPFLPPTVLVDESKKGPLEPVNAGFYPNAQRRCDATLYRVADDEGTVGTMFVDARSPSTTLAADKRYQGVVVVRIQFMIDFDATFRDKSSRAPVLDQIHSMFSSHGRAKLVFALEPDPLPPAAAGRTDPPFLRRIAVIFNPEYDLRSRHPRNGVPPAAGHVNLRIHQPGTVLARRPMLEDAPATPMDITSDDIDVWLVRYALGLPTYFENSAGRHASNIILSEELVGVAVQVSRILKDPPGTKRRVYQP
jgi:hypothetical protein